MNDIELIPREIIQKYKDDIVRLNRYLPWLEAKKSKKMVSFYRDNELEKTSLTVPIFNSTLLQFVKEAKETKLMDTNYIYIYSKFRIKNYKDEWKLIESCKIQDISIIKGILSKYVLKGMTKSILWSDAIEYSIFLKIVKQLNKLVDLWGGESDG